MRLNNSSEVQREKVANNESSNNWFGILWYTHSDDCESSEV